MCVSARKTKVTKVYIVKESERERERVSGCQRVQSLARVLISFVIAVLGPFGVCWLILRLINYYFVFILNHTQVKNLHYFSLRNFRI